MSKRNGFTDIYVIDMDHAAEVYADPNLVQGPKMYDSVARSWGAGNYIGMKKNMFELEVEVWEGSKIVDTVSFYIDSFGEMHEQLKKLQMVHCDYAQFIDWLHNTDDVLTLDTEDYKRYTFDTSKYNYDLYLNRALNNETSDDTILPIGVMNK